MKLLSLPVTDWCLSRPELFVGRCWTEVAGGTSCSDQSFVRALMIQLFLVVGSPGWLGGDRGVCGERGRPSGGPTAALGRLPGVRGWL